MKNSKEQIQKEYAQICSALGDRVYRYNLMMADEISLKAHKYAASFHHGGTITGHSFNKRVKAYEKGYTDALKWILKKIDFKKDDI